VLGFEFISILLILVYVGAIAVLFLFVVMLLDLKQRPITSRSTRHYIIVGFLGLIFFFEILYILVPAFNIQKIKILPYINWFDLFSFTSQSDLYIIGSVMYTKYFHFLLLVGIILLVAMIGAIVLTLNFKTKTKSQSISKQLSRN
jgi:NADH-quinone oxidoreductase subunit J